MLCDLDHVAELLNLKVFDGVINFLEFYSCGIMGKSHPTFRGRPTFKDFWLLRIFGSKAC